MATNRGTKRQAEWDAEAISPPERVKRARTQLRLDGENIQVARISNEEVQLSDDSIPNAIVGPRRSTRIRRSPERFPGIITQPSPSRRQRNVTASQKHRSQQKAPETPQGEHNQQERILPEIVVKTEEPEYSGLQSPVSQDTHHDEPLRTVGPQVDEVQLSSEQEAEAQAVLPSPQEDKCEQQIEVVSFTEGREEHPDHHPGGMEYFPYQWAGSGSVNLDGPQYQRYADEDDLASESSYTVLASDDDYISCGSSDDEDDICEPDCECQHQHAGEGVCNDYTIHTMDNGVTIGIPRHQSDFWRPRHYHGNDDDEVDDRYTWCDPCPDAQALDPDDELIPHYKFEHGDDSEDEDLHGLCDDNGECLHPYRGEEENGDYTSYESEDEYDTRLRHQEERRNRSQAYDEDYQNYISQAPHNNPIPSVESEYYEESTAEEEGGEELEEFFRQDLGEFLHGFTGDELAQDVPANLGMVDGIDGVESASAPLSHVSHLPIEALANAWYNDVDDME